MSLKEALGGALVGSDDLVDIPAVVVARPRGVGAVLQGIGGGGAAQVVEGASLVPHVEAGLPGTAAGHLLDAQPREVFGVVERAVGNEPVAGVVDAADEVPLGAIGIGIHGDGPQREGPAITDSVGG
jgi:hypothetical protein